MPAAEAHFAQRAERNPATMEGLRGSIRDAVEAVLGTAATSAG